MVLTEVSKISQAPAGLLFKDLQFLQQPLQGPLPRRQRREAKVGIGLGPAQLLQPGAQGLDVRVLQDFFGKFQGGKNLGNLYGLRFLVDFYSIKMGELGDSSWEDHVFELFEFHRIIEEDSRIHIYIL